MALAFSKTKGKAISNKVDSYEYKDGDNIVRLVGGVLPRYVYWIKGTNNKDIPVECLSFDRELEKFTNTETDHVTSFYPDKKCSWSYVANGYDVKADEKKIVAINLKKKLFDAIITLAEDLGDPTDPETGWDIYFKKVKTGPLAYNVEYHLQQLKCKKRTLSGEEVELIAKAKTIDEKFPRPTPEDVLKTLEKIQNGASEDENADEATKEAAADL